MVFIVSPTKQQKRLYLRRGMKEHQDIQRWLQWPSLCAILYIDGEDVMELRRKQVESHQTETGCFKVPLFGSSIWLTLAYLKQVWSIEWSILLSSTISSALTVFSRIPVSMSKLSWRHKCKLWHVDRNLDLFSKGACSQMQLQRNFLPTLSELNSRPSCVLLQQQSLREPRLW